MKEFSISDILKIYPHRYPMLLVESVTLNDDGSCIGYKNVTIDELRLLHGKTGLLYTKTLRDNQTPWRAVGLVLNSMLGLNGVGN